MVQLSDLYMTTGETTALTRQTFVSKVMSLLFNMLSRFVIAFFQEASILIKYNWECCLVVVGGGDSWRTDFPVKSEV